MAIPGTNPHFLHIFPGHIEQPAQPRPALARDREFVTIIGREGVEGAAKENRRGVLSRNNTRIGVLKLKLLLLQGGTLTFIKCHVPLH